MDQSYNFNDLYTSNRYLVIIIIFYHNILKNEQIKIKRLAEKMKWKSSDIHSAYSFRISF